MQTLNLGKVREIIGAEDHVLVPIEIKGEEITAHLFAPHYLGVTIAPFDMLDHGIARIFLESLATVGGIGHTLGMRLACRKGGVAACRSVEEQNRISLSRFQTADVVFIHDAAAREHGSQRIGPESGVQLVPMDEILGDGVSPSHIPPVAVGRIVLEEHMIAFTVEHQAVGIVNPTDFSGKVHHRTKFFVIIPLCGNHIHEGKAQINLGNSGESDRLALEMGYVHIRIKVRCNEVDVGIEVPDQLAVLVKADFLLFGVHIHGHDDVLVFNLYRIHCHSVGLPFQNHFIIPLYTIPRRIARGNFPKFSFG